MSMIRLSSRREVFVPEARIHEIEMVREEAPDGSTDEFFHVELRGMPVRRFRSEPTTEAVIAAAGGISVLVPADLDAVATEWLRYPVIAWSVTTGAATGTVWGSEPVCDPDPMQSFQEREQAVLIDATRRQARRWHDDLWRDDLAQVLGAALGTKVEVIGADPWSGPLTTQRLT